MKVVLDRVHHETDNIISFWFKPPKVLHYTAGQYIELSIPHSNPDELGIKRWFTLSSSPTDEPLVSITTKFNLAGNTTFKTALRAMKIGSKVVMSEPMGDFVLPKDPAIQLIFVAGGIGITPFHSMIKYLNDKKQHRKIQFIYGVRTESDAIFNQLLNDYGLEQYTMVVSEPIPGWRGEKGKLSAERILELSGAINNKLLYVSGPEPMVENLYKDLAEKNIPKSQLVADYFPNYTDI